MAVTSRRSVDVRISWGDAVLLVAELAPPRQLFVGSDDAWRDGEERAACALPEAAIGARRAALVDIEADGAVTVFVPPGASAELLEEGRTSRTRAELVGEGVGRRCDAIPGALRVRLPIGARLRIDTGEFAFEVTDGDAATKTPRSRVAWRGPIGTLASAVFHLAILFAFARYLPPLDGSADDLTIDADRGLGSLGPFVPVSAEPDFAMPDAAALAAADRRGSDLGVDDGGAEAMGARRAPHAPERYGVAGPADNPDPHIAARDRGSDGPWFDGIGLPKPAGGDLHAPLAPWGRDDSLGNDRVSARGEMWGDEIEESFGAAGLGLAGEAECGCGSARALAFGETRDLLQIVRVLDEPPHEVAAVTRRPALIRGR